MTALPTIITKFLSYIHLSMQSFYKKVRYSEFVAYHWKTLSLLSLLFAILFAVSFSVKTPTKIISPILSTLSPLSPLKQSKKGYEVFGFAPYWTIDKLDNVDYNTLTTLAYFGMQIDSNGDIVQDDPIYITFQCKKATEIFKKAHAAGTRVVLTITSMNNSDIEGLLDSPDAQENAISQVVSEVKKRGIDGINVDFEYVGNPGVAYRNAYSTFIANLTARMHQEEPESKVTISVYASSAKPGSPRLYDIATLGKTVDGVFMMAYDFAVAGSDNAEPTAPLYGYKQGKYSYDVSTAVNDFLAQMPADKLILGVPYYGYNYVTYEPSVNAETRPYYSWRGTPHVNTYASAQDDITPTMDGIDAYKTGWDNVGEVSYRAYHVVDTDTWRVIFLDDAKSLGMKYDFAKSKNLQGVGMWALGFDNGRSELWNVLRQKFGTKYADTRIVNKAINEDI